MDRDLESAWRPWPVWSAVFLAFVAGGWVAARVAGLRRAEPAMLHGVIAWLVTIPIMLLLTALGATAVYGGWYAGIVAGPAGMALPPMTPELAAGVRNGALAAVVALRLGMIGGVLGGWMASGEPMRISYHRRRGRAAFDQTRRAA